MIKKSRQRTRAGDGNKGRGLVFKQSLAVHGRHLHSASSQSNNFVTSRGLKKKATIQKKESEANNPAIHDVSIGIKCTAVF